jgi:thiol-disulfide isomerase/thioredoxin
MKVQLLVSEWCNPCRAAEEIWRRVAEEKAITFEVLDVAQPEGRAVASPRGIRTVPATVIDGTLKKVGVPTRDEALALVAGAGDRAASSLRHVGLSLEATSRWAIAAAALYLALAGSALVLGGGIVGDAPWRAAAVHVFGIGFVTLMIFGLGEHLLPRFTGAPIRMGAAAWLQQALAHAGTLLLAGGLYAEARTLAVAGGVLMWLAFALFAARVVPVLRSGAGES